LSFSGGVFACQFDGDVTELSTGTEGRQRNWMPNWLSWLRGRDSLIQFWALFGSLVTLALAVNRFWRDPE
jgi:hypothetical protein